MPSILERIRAGEVLLSDGAMGTLLLGKGLKPGGCPEALNLTHPEFLEEIARDYFEAGADIVQTNTFGGSPLKLASYQLADKTEEINSAAVKAARNAVGGRAFVVASCGTTGKLLKPYGDTEPEAIADSFKRQVQALARSGVDAVNFETMTDLAEAVLAVRAARSVASSLTVMATMTFQATKRGFFTMMGNSIADVARGLADAGADIVGSNCGNGSAEMLEIAREFKKATDLPISIRPNAGAPTLAQGVPVYPETPEFMAEKVGEMAAIGVSIIGGCCGTTPAHIRAFRAVLDARAEASRR